jgi:dienelactone hydrolase
MVEIRWRMLHREEDTLLKTHAMKPARIGLSIILLATAHCLRAQSTPGTVTPILEVPLQTSEVARFQLINHLLPRATPLRVPTSPAEWTSEARRLRRHLLDDVIFHGWPREWVTAPPRFEEMGTIASAEGFRIRKFRYEIVPGFWSTALLYEPERVGGKLPAILNLLGHYRDGKAMAFEQKRCSNYALQGMFALDLEWLGQGELRQPENGHWFAADLDLVGANAAGLFYLAMRKGLDFLDAHPGMDRSRLGATGLSGGGWQTIVLGALDERVAVAVPVAGTCSLISKLDRPNSSNIGDLEEVPTDLLFGLDYAHLVAMRAPRPTLLIYNAEDDCCYRAALTKPYMYENVLPIFRLFGKEERLQWHENTDPGTHNYELDNRQQSYRFFSESFGLPGKAIESSVDREIRSAEQLSVGVPPNNLTILGLARKLAGEIKRQPLPADANARSRWAAATKTRLNTLVRYSPVSVAHPWMLANTRSNGIETLSYRFALGNGLSATGVWLKAITAPSNAPVTIVLHDQGKRAAGEAVSEAVNRGDQVLALDLLLSGDAAPDSPWEYAALLATTGERPLGIEAAQLIALVKWLQAGSSGREPVRVVTTGIRSQTVALVAAALEQTLFAEIVVRNGMKSLSDLFDVGVPYKQAPELFCLDLYKDFDLDILAVLANPVKVFD